MHLPCGSWNVRLVVAMFESLPSLWNFPQYWNHVGFWESRVRFAYKLQNFFPFFCCEFAGKNKLAFEWRYKRTLMCQFRLNNSLSPMVSGYHGKKLKRKQCVLKNLNTHERPQLSIYYSLYGYQVMIGFLCSIFRSIEVVLKYAIENEFWILNIKGIVMSALSHG